MANDYIVIRYLTYIIFIIKRVYTLESVGGSAARSGN